MSTTNSSNKVRAVLNSFRKSAAAHTLTVADGRGGETSVTDGSIKTDPGAADVKTNLPATGALPDVANPSKANGNNTVADARQDCASASVPGDPGQADLKANLPDGATIKTASSRVANIAALISGKTPEQLAPAVTTKTAAAPSVSLDETVLIKIAKAVLETEEGMRFALDTMEKSAGAAKARELMQEAINAATNHDQSELYKIAAFNDVNNKAVGYHNWLAQVGCTEEAAADMLKQAALHEDALAQMDDMEKMAYAGGMEDAAAMEEAALAEEGAPPVDEAIAMGGEEPTEEDIMAVIQEMIASGELSEEELMQAIEMASQGEEGAAAAAPAPEAVPA